MYNTIVVGYDESESSKAALKEASLRVKNKNGKLFLVHAVYFDQEEFAILPSQMEKRFEAGTHVCLQAKKDLNARFGLNGSVESFVCEGEPAAVLADIAQGKKADLIALGTYGRKGLNRLLMGSVTSEVILSAPCDVLVVKRPCAECTGSYTSLLVPFDGSEFSKKAMTRALEMAKAEGTKVTVLYVIPRYEEMMEFYRSESIKKSLMLEAEKVVQQAKDMAAGMGITVATAIREGHASDEIAATAAKLENDLIAMGTYGWKGMSKAIMGSTTNRVISHANCPILVVK
ncbi:MAG: universal stress protein [Nitrospirota bacterium]|nr:universal stress protein [Nitrospirota bacterium]